MSFPKHFLECFECVRVSACKVLSWKAACTCFWERRTKHRSARRAFQKNSHYLHMHPLTEKARLCGNGFPSEQQQKSSTNMILHRVGLDLVDTCISEALRVGQLFFFLTCVVPETLCSFVKGINCLRCVKVSWAFKSAV